MTARPRVRYLCQECGYASVRWVGKCPECEGWNTFIEQAETPDQARAGGPTAPRAVPLTEVGGEDAVRLATGIRELDRVLGGGLVVGSVVLIGGEPGIGKSTLLLQTLASLAALGRRVLYVSGEESMRQIRLRAERLEVVRPELLLSVETCLESVVDGLLRERPDVAVIDSVQVMYSGQSTSPPGTVVQVREVTNRLVSLAKREGISIFLVGHVTKEGNLAGPKLLEHMVDTVLSFEGDNRHLARVIRATKNRFGSTDEIGVFQMTDGGLAEIDNPSRFFLGPDRPPQPGTAVFPCMEGQRPILVEVQALVLPTAFGAGRRSVSGLELNRVVMLLAVLEKHVGLVFGSSDVYMNVAGGLRVTEPALDMASLAALASSHRGVQPPAATMAAGEVSLTGDLRPVVAAELRLREGAKLGFRRAVVPAGTREMMREPISGLELIEVRDVSGLVSAYDM